MSSAPLPSVARADLVVQLSAWGVDEVAAGSLVARSATIRDLLVSVLEQIPGPVARIEGSLPPTHSRAGQAAADGRALDAEPSPEPRVASETQAPRNQWNAFQHRMRGAGLSQAALRQAYQEERAAAELLPVRPDIDTVPSSVLSTLGRSNTPHGYTVLRAPAIHRGILGIHLCSWTELLAKFDVSTEAWQSVRDDYYVPRYVSILDSAEKWAGQKLPSPVPIFIGAGSAPSDTLDVKAVLGGAR